MSPNSSPNRRTYTTVFLDMAGTMSRLRPSWEGLYHQIFTKAGYDLPLGEVAAAAAESWAQVAREDPITAYEATKEGTRRWQREVEERVMERLGIHPRVREDLFWQIIEAFEAPTSYELYPDVLTTLDALRAAGYRLAIISNWSWHLPELCQSLGISGYFEQIFTSARIGFAKPNPRIFQHALQGMEIEANQAVHVGDSLAADVGGALAVGLDVLWLARPEDRPLYDEAALKLTPDRQPTARLTSLNQLLPFLQSNQ